jgi:hypothetical protein
MTASVIQNRVYLYIKITETISAERRKINFPYNYYWFARTNNNNNQILFTIHIDQKEDASKEHEQCFQQGERCWLRGTFQTRDSM